MSQHVSRTGGLLGGLRNRALGAGFVVLVVVLGGLTYAIFDKSFASYDDVTLRASHLGLQLPSRADVKIRGVQVGEVLGTTVRRDGDGVDLRLGLYPGERRTIPENVSARIVPKTLFGEKYVALQVPARPSARSIRAGDVISESRVAIEVEKVLSDIYPLLRTVQPAQLNYTLTALADALEGRGDKVGSSLVVLDDYLKRMNPKIPLLVDDLGKLATVSDTYASVVPELATVLRNSVKTGHTFVEKEAKVQALFDDVAGLSSTSKDFLEQNGSNIIRLSRQGQAQLPLFEKYAPEYPCLLGGIVGAIPLEAQAFRGYTLHINLEPLPRQPRGYTAADQPVYAERGENRVPLDQCQAAVHGVYGQGNLPPDSLVPP
ncbi:MCE family protein [Nocardioides panacis]|uniref:MCE family protein n=1 Tax=Nocardioides panacis TaxID=2849501 RepID=A0A975SW40_9ACTN|nr:MCE family protein [Nocardioides panacis]QWZ07004.1 MCE family protein [Nocardioides panacis]